MPNYRRVYTNGGTYFFTVVTYHRTPIFIHDDIISLLHHSFDIIKEKRTFTIEACVILPDHLHTIWTLPDTDADFSTRWMLIKNTFSRLHKKEIGYFGKVWQNRFWEHLIKDERDLTKLYDYIHYNPVKHGYSLRSQDWKYSTFSRFVEKGIYEADWGENPESTLPGMDLE